MKFGSSIGMQAWVGVFNALDEHAIVSVTDRRGVITSVNDRFCAISGYAREELIGRSHRIVKSGRHDETLYRNMWETIAAGRTWHGLICNRRKNGGHYWVQSTIVPMCDEHGVVQQFVSVRTDITERVQAQEQSSYLAQVLDRTDQGAIITDLSGHILYVNKAAAQALGYEAALMRGRSCLDFVMPAIRRRCERVLRRVSTCDFRWEGPMAMLRQDGTCYMSRSHIGVVADSGGYPVRIFNMFSDHGKDLEKLATLRHAKDEAEKASSAKSAFLSYTSHEFRTPLHAVLGFAQLLQLQLVDERFKGYAREIGTAGRHLLALIDEILDLARVEAGYEVMQLESVDLHAILQEGCALIRPMADAKGIELVWDPSGAPMSVRADRRRLLQVFLNLASNAMKYSPAQSQVSLALIQPSADKVRLTVADQGPGIKPALLPGLFEPFNRLDADGSGIEGTGIGLALSKRLMERMGGRIGVDSQPGAGSRFWLELPVASPLPIAAT